MWKCVYKYSKLFLTTNYNIEYMFVYMYYVYITHYWSVGLSVLLIYNIKNLTRFVYAWL